MNEAFYEIDQIDCIRERESMICSIQINQWIIKREQQVNDNSIEDYQRDLT